MTVPETAADDMGVCAYCERPLVDRGKRPRGGQALRKIDNIIPFNRCNCNHPDNKVYVCGGRDGCKRAKGNRTPLEYYNQQVSSDAFDAGGWSLRQRERFLAQCAYWEAHALAHLQKEHHKRPFYNRSSTQA